MEDGEFFLKFLREWVTGPCNAATGRIVASWVARLQVIVLVQSSKITMKGGLLGRKEPTLVLLSGQLTDAEANGVTRNIAVQI